jgi:thiamine biosynthesis lipoprotein
VASSRFDAIGVPWRVDVGDEGSGALGDGGSGALDDDDLTAVRARIEQFDRHWSRFRPDSLVSRIAREAGSWPLPEDAAPLLDLYRALHDLTDGRLSPLAGAALEQLGYDAAYRLEPRGAPRAAPRWGDALSLRQTPAGLVLDCPAPVLLDVGAAGKGYLVDIVGDLLQARGATETVVDASGDLRSWGERSIRVALENPANPTKAVGVVEVHDEALCGSATNRRAWGDGLHHIVDATTGRPVGGVIATWAIAESALLADGLATALFLAEPARLAERFAFQWVRLFDDGRLEGSPDLSGELFA